MRRERQRTADIVRYWRAVELFSPPTIPRPSRPTHRQPGTEWVMEVEPTAGGQWPLLPWQDGHPLRNEGVDERRYAWRHTVYGGVFELDEVRKALAATFGGETEDHAGRHVGETAVFAFVVEDDGVLVDDSAVFSSCAWATGRVRDPGPGDPAWLDGFRIAAKECSAAIGMLTRMHVPYAPDIPRPPAAPSVPVSGAASPAFRPVPAPEGNDAPRTWLGIVGEVLGSAAVGALGVLLGDLGTGLLAGAAAPLVREARRRRTATPTPTPGSAGTHARPLTTGVPSPVAIPSPGRPAPDAEPAGSDTTTAVEDLPGRAVQLPDLVAFAAHVAEVCGVEDLAPATGLRVQSRLVRRRKDGSLPDADPPFLNSFLLDDLELVGGKAESGFGKALTEYLTPDTAIIEHDRVDVAKDPIAVIDGLAPDRFPHGRWPANSTHPLATSQQFAINAMFDPLANGSGLFSVNGPPGTGKTTMLRDLIAAVVVARAFKIAELPRPSAAFTKTAHTWPGASGTRTVPTLAPQLCGHEIVVASSNNGAVENITTELPSLAAIDQEWHGEASYFLDQATALLKGAPAWGLIAAPLGRADKRKDFLEAFWWGNEPREPAGTHGRASTQRARRTTPDGAEPPLEVPGMRTLLSKLDKREPLLDPPAGIRHPHDPPTRPMPTDSDTTPAETRWEEAVRRFRTAAEAEARIRADRAAVDAAWCSRAARDTELAAADADIVPRQQSEGRAARNHESAVADTYRTHAWFLEAEQQLQGHRLDPPGTLQSMFGRRSTRDWHTRDAFLAGRVTASRNAWYEADAREQQAANTLEAARLGLNQALRRVETATLELENVDRLLDTARRLRPEHTPTDWGNRDEQERELSAPWSDPEWTTARTRLFLAALDLHRALIANNAFTVSRALNAVVDVLSGRGAVPAAAARAAWQTLFLVVPVVSTTFASCGRLFADLAKESIGWLLVDEAGQATPQAAVGALWRAKRAVLVGDPLQLEPVVTLPVTVQELLRRTYGVAPEWIPSHTSAQRLADRSNRYGTHLDDCRPEGTTPVWVGAPLRVHRRCERPMFDISNAIAYDGLMVYGTREQPFPAPPLREYPAASAWVDVRGTIAHGKWVPDEGAALLDVLTKLHHRFDVPLAHVRVLSPFRDVVTACRRLIRDQRWGSAPPPGSDAAAYRSSVDRFVQGNIGTVHTMQGKESDVVILVLGTHPTRGDRARAWAASTPNLLNVAVSRAKRRLFVIGNHQVWSAEPYFNRLADTETLPRHIWTPRPTGTGPA